MKSEFTAAHDVLRSHLFSVREKTPRGTFHLDRAASSDIRTGYVDGEPVNRLVITLRGPGCAWVKRGGGCLMCGHYAGTTRGIVPSADETIAQFRKEIDRYDMTTVKVVSLYNSGSVLNPDELPFGALKSLCREIACIPSISKVVFESRAEYIDRDKLLVLKDILGQRIMLTIAIGLETSDDVRRALCVNKGCTRRDIEQALWSIRGIAESQLYVLLGIPFLTESEAITDAVESIRYAHLIGAGEIHIEPLTLQAHTFLGILVREGLYRLPSLYSVYEVLKQVVPGIKPYVSPFMHMPLPDRIPGGCPRCTERLIHGLLNIYNMARTPESLVYGECGCLDDWYECRAESDERPLHQRITDALRAVSCGVER